MKLTNVGLQFSVAVVKNPPNNLWIIAAVLAPIAVVTVIIIIITAVLCRKNKSDFKPDTMMNLPQRTKVSDWSANPRCLFAFWSFYSDSLLGVLDGSFGLLKLQTAGLLWFLPCCTIVDWGESWRKVWCVWQVLSPHLSTTAEWVQLVSAVSEVILKIHCHLIPNMPIYLPVRT